MKNVEYAYNLVTEAIRKKIGMQIQEQTITDSVSREINKQKGYVADMIKDIKDLKFSEKIAQDITDRAVAIAKQGFGLTQITNQLKREYGEVFAALEKDRKSRFLFPAMDDFQFEVGNIVDSEKQINRTITETQSLFASIIGQQTQIVNLTEKERLQREMAAAETKEQKEEIRNQIDREYGKGFQWKENSHRRIGSASKIS